MVCVFKGFVSPHSLAHAPQELRGEAVDLERNEILLWTVIENQRADETFGDFYGGLTLQMDCLQDISESFDDH